MHFPTTLLALAAATSALAAPTVEKRQYNGQPGYPKAVVFIETFNTPDRENDTVNTFFVPLGYGYTSEQQPVLKNVSYLSVAGGVGSIDPRNIECVANKDSDFPIHFNSTVPFTVYATPMEVEVVTCSQGRNPY